jgi:hypothetical protein
MTVPAALVACTATGPPLATLVFTGSGGVSRFSDIMAAIISSGVMSSTLIAYSLGLIQRY